MATEAAAAAAPASVWVQLNYYYEGEENPVEDVDPIEIEPIPKNVNELKKMVQAKAKTTLDVDLYNLKVYASGTDVPVAEGVASLIVYGPVPTNSTGPSPLIVVVRKPVQKNAAHPDTARLVTENALLQLQLKLVKSTTERLWTFPDNELAAMYDKAETVSEVWLPQSPQNVSWAGNWHLYSTTDAQKKESAVIQPAINNEFEPNFPLASPYVMKDTSSGWQTLTQDATLFLKDRCKVELTAAAIFEWVGQDESPFPSKKHKGKFIRDCMRLNS
eukprot:scaffold9991_cov48-Attheya_sp.AAC.1